MSLQRRCPLCRKLLPAEAFHRDANDKMGRQRVCRHCKRDYNAAYQRTPIGRKRHNLASRNYWRRQHV